VTGSSTSVSSASSSSAAKPKKKKKGAVAATVPPPKKTNAVTKPKEEEAVSEVKKPPAVQSPSVAPPAPSPTSGKPASRSREPSVTLSRVDPELVTRDEMVGCLLSMGFPEADCLAALSACGTNLDRAISWLCERPDRNTVSQGTENNTSASTIDKGKKSSGGVGAGSSSVSVTSNPSSTVTGPVERSDSTQNSSASQAAAAAAAATQRESDLKEQLRKINRAWNAKVPLQRAAEEERKKVSKHNVTATECRIE